jgi:putative transposase
LNLERWLSGTVRREYLDQVPFWSARDLERKLMSFQDYYNKDRVHRRLDGAPPNEQGEITDRKVADLDDYRWEKRCRGLYQLPAAA